MRYFCISLLIIFFTISCKTEYTKPLFSQTQMKIEELNVVTFGYNSLYIKDYSGIKEAEKTHYGYSSIFITNKEGDENLKIKRINEILKNFREDGYIIKHLSVSSDYQHIFFFIKHK